MENYFQREKPFIMKFASYEIQFLPLSTPLEEHLRSLSVFVNGLLMITGGIIFFPFLLLLLLFTRFWILVILYVAWVYYDRETGFQGGRKWNWFRNLKMFKLYRDYFPVQLIKTAELPPGKNYLLIMYPHGVLPFSVMANFASEANNVESEVFPGIDMRVITLDVNLLAPFSREYFLAIGACGCSESSITYLLNDPASSKGVVLLPGGATEASLAQPGPVYTIITSRRKGFVRIALSTGTSLVPVFSFGENNVYQRQIEYKWVLNLQDMCQKILGFRPVLPVGRGLLQNTFGFLPRSTKIHTVVGKPIDIPKIENPSNEVIDEYHKKFVDALKSLFEEYKEQYDEARSEATLITI